MILSEYIRELQELIERNPEAAELTVVYSRDDEGNGFQEVYCTGTMGHHDGNYGGEWYPVDNLNASDMGLSDDEWEDSKDDYPINPVCVN